MWVVWLNLERISLRGSALGAEDPAAAPRGGDGGAGLRGWRLAMWSGCVLWLGASALRVVSALGWWRGIGRMIIFFALFFLQCGYFIN